eukprot:jgi/Bigna1/86779/estExt_fgenesh1_pg.C_130232
MSQVLHRLPSVADAFCQKGRFPTKSISSQWFASIESKDLNRAYISPDVRKSFERIRRISTHINPSIDQERCSVSGERCAMSGGLKPKAMTLTLAHESEGVLTQEQRAAYERDGFLVVKGLVSDEDIEIYRKRFVEICTNKKERVPSMLVMRDISSTDKANKVGENAITKIQDFQDDPILFRYCTHPKILRYARCFTGKEIKSVHTMLIQKPPQKQPETGRHPFHQGKLRPHSYPEFMVNKAYYCIEKFDINSKPRIHLVMEKGDTVFFHPLLIHGSGANRTKRYRKAISCHYSNAKSKYIDVEGTIQEGMARELEAAYKKNAKKFGLSNGELQIQDLWRWKSRIIKDKSSRLQCSNFPVLSLSLRMKAQASARSRQHSTLVDWLSRREASIRVSQHSSIENLLYSEDSHIPSVSPRYIETAKAMSRGVDEDKRGAFVVGDCVKITVFKNSCVPRGYRAYTSSVQSTNGKKAKIVGFEGEDIAYLRTAENRKAQWKIRKVNAKDMRKVARKVCGFHDALVDILFEYATLRFHKWMKAGVHVSKHTNSLSPSHHEPKPRKRNPQNPDCHTCSSLKSWGIDTFCSVCARN